MESDDDVPQLLEVDDVPDAEAGPSRPTPSDPYARPRIPLTLLTGYLGAGKSTLLEYILTADHGYRIAVCMNDFGDTTDIEAKALTLSDPSTGEQSTSFLSLPNGCLCCSVKDLGIAAIEEMVVNQRDKVDWVMVELTGVADPGPIAKSFWENEEMGDLVLDGIVCVVDSKNFVRQLDPSEPGQINEAQRQLAASDVILLNKVDLVSPEHLANVRFRVKSINPTLRIHETIRGQMPLREIFNLRAYSDTTAELQFLKESAPRSNGVTNGADHAHQRDHEHDDGTAHAHSAHLNDISTILIPLPRLSADQWTKLNTFLETVLWEGKIPSTSGFATVPKGSPNEKKMDILRCKGLLRLEDAREIVLQGVMDIFELKEVAQKSAAVSETLSDDKEQGGKVVFIGRGVEVLKPALEAFVGFPT